MGGARGSLAVIGEGVPMTALEAGLGCSSVPGLGCSSVPGRQGLGGAGAAGTPDGQPGSLQPLQTRLSGEPPSSIALPLSPSARPLGRPSRMLAVNTNIASLGACVRACACACMCVHACI